MDKRLSRRQFVAAAAVGSEAAAFAQNRGTPTVPASCRADDFRRNGEVPARAFGAVGDGRADDTVALQAAVDHAVSSGIGRVFLAAGHYRISSTIRLENRGISVIGNEASNRQFGSATRSSYLVWTGGSAPMFRSTSSFGSFRGFGVENRGAATDFLEMNAGLGYVFDDLSFVRAESHRPFSRSVIRSNGNRLGYSVFRQITGKSPSAVFIDIDGQGTGNGITNILFEGRCIFDSSAGPLTILRLNDESIENLTIRDCTFNVNGPHELTIVDTRRRPLPATINCLAFQGNEIDVAAPLTGSERFFRLVNVGNVTFNNNMINGGGLLSALALLINSNVASCEGNHWKSLAGPLFEADPRSIVHSGFNMPDPRNTQGEFKAPTAGFVQLDFGPAMQIDSRRTGADRHGIFRIDVTNSDAYQIQIGTARPFSTLPGFVFTLVVRNVTGGRVKAPSFSESFRLQGPAAAPAAGHSRSYSFFFDGTHAVEIARTAADVPNS